MLSVSAVGVSMEICILAGGLGSRMGRDKGRLRLGQRSLLGHVRANAASTGLPFRVIRKDLVGRCGPLGGIYTALKTTEYESVVILACDMPFVSGSMLKSLARKFDGQRPLFAVGDEPGFPLIVAKTGLGQVESRIARGQFSLHGLATAMHARLVKVPNQLLFNINTPEDLNFARDRWRAAQEQLVKRR